MSRRPPRLTVAGLAEVAHTGTAVTSPLAQGRQASHRDEIQRALDALRLANTIAIDVIASRLGALVAMYEHNVFTQKTISWVNSFDRWGFELGKVVASRILPTLTSVAEPALAHDGSTDALITRYRRRAHEFPLTLLPS